MYCYQTQAGTSTTPEVNHVNLHILVNLVRHIFLQEVESKLNLSPTCFFRFLSSPGDGLAFFGAGRDPPGTPVGRGQDLQGVVPGPLGSTPEPAPDLGGAQMDLLRAKYGVEIVLECFRSWM